MVGKNWVGIDKMFASRIEDLIKQYEQDLIISNYDIKNIKANHSRGTFEAMII